MKKFLIGLFFPFIIAIDCLKFAINHVVILVGRLRFPQFNVTYAEVKTSDHTKSEKFLYFLGIATPYIISLLLIHYLSSDGYNHRDGYMYKYTLCTIYFWYFSTVFFVLITIIFPVGDVAEILNSTDVRRKYMGIPSSPSVFQTENGGLTTLLLECLGMLIVLNIGSTTAMFLTQYGGNPMFSNFSKEFYVFDCECASISCYFYFFTSSISIIFSHAFGGVDPVSMPAQILVITAILISTIFFIGLFPPLLQLATATSKHSHHRYINDSILSTTLSQSISKLEKMGKKEGYWSGVTNNCCTTRALIGIYYKQSGNHELALEYKKLQKQEENKLSQIIWELFDTGDTSSCDNRLHELNENEQPLIHILLLSLGYTPRNNMAFDHFDDARKEYGIHWATYSLVFEFLNGRITMNDYTNTLEDAQNLRGSFYGDTILTIIILLSFLKEEFNPPLCDKAKRWITLIDPNKIQRPFESLKVWDTAHALLTLRRYGYSYLKLSPILKWIKEQFNEKEKLWSWSPESGKIMCLDSTTLILEATNNNSFKDWRLDKISRDCNTKLNNLFRSNQTKNTFYDGETLSVYCPIIHARFLWLHHKSDKTEWDNVALKANSSPWFNDEIISSSWVVYYASKTIITPNNEIKKIATRIMNSVKEKSARTLEGKLCSIIAIMSFLRNWDILESTESKKEIVLSVFSLFDSIINTNYKIDDGWESQDAGYFGHGINYHDKVFTTSIACIALMETLDYLFEQKMP